MHPFKTRGILGTWLQTRLGREKPRTHLRGASDSVKLAFLSLEPRHFSTTFSLSSCASTMEALLQTGWRQVQREAQGSRNSWTASAAAGQRLSRPSAPNAPASLDLRPSSCSFISYVLEASSSHPVPDWLKSHAAKAQATQRTRRAQLGLPDTAQVLRDRCQATPQAVTFRPVAGHRSQGFKSRAGLPCGAGALNTKPTKLPGSLRANWEAYINTVV